MIWTDVLTVTQDEKKNLDQNLNTKMSIKQINPPALPEFLAGTPVSEVMWDGGSEATGA